MTGKATNKATEDRDKPAAPGGFAIKKLVRALLKSPDFDEALASLDIPPVKIVNPLLGFLVEIDELTRWRAVRGVGITVSAMAATNLDSAREIMRRLIWSLNDESGGIGWGAPEAMGEIMAENETLCREYHCILVSYIDENGNPLENGLLERGVMWGLCRLAQKRPAFLRDWTGPILAQVQSPDPVKRGLALRTLLWLARFPENLPEPGRLLPLLPPLLDDPSEVRTFQDGEMVCYNIGAMARELMLQTGLIAKTSGGPDLTTTVF
jgi:hypothetical protein